jgi:hypothetical protein
VARAVADRSAGAGVVTESVCLLGPGPVNVRTRDALSIVTEGDE